MTSIPYSREVIVPAGSLSLKNLKNRSSDLSQPIALSLLATTDTSINGGTPGRRPSIPALSNSEAFSSTHQSLRVLSSYGSFLKIIIIITLGKQLTSLSVRWRQS